MLEIAAVTIMVIGFIFLPQLKLNRLLGVFDKKRFSVFSCSNFEFCDICTISVI